MLYWPSAHGAVPGIHSPDGITYLAHYEFDNKPGTSPEAWDKAAATASTTKRRPALKPFINLGKQSVESTEGSQRKQSVSDHSL